MIISGARHIDYASLGARVLKVAGGFAAAGVSTGDCVGIMLRNDIAFFEAVAGTTGCGGSIVPINWHMKAEEVGYILRDSAAKALVIHADLVAQVADGIRMAYASSWFRRRRKWPPRTISPLRTTCLPASR